MFEVFVKDLEFYGYHGVTSQEQAIGHRYRATARLQVDGVADETDELGDTVDYGSLAALILNLGTAKQYATVERLARVVADGILARFDSVRECEVEVAKMLPPMPVVAREAGAIIIRSRVEVEGRG